MKICYVDESGDTGEMSTAVSPVPPALVITGIVLDHHNLGPITEDFIELKRRRFPGLTKRDRYLNSILAEIKGNEIRKLAASSSRRKRRQAFGFLDEVLALLETYEAKIIGRIWVKGIGVPIDADAIYTFSIQSIYQFFQNYLATVDDYGVVIADSRTQSLNTTVSHSIFTQKFKRDGDDYDRIAELPAFSHSDNHCGLQLSDAICSAFLFPMAMQSYCAGTISNVHVRPGYERWKPRYGARLQRLQHRYQEASGRWVGGITVADALGRQGGRVLFS